MSLIVSSEPFPRLPRCCQNDGVTVTRPSLPAGSHGASHSELDRLSPADALEADAGVLAATPVPVEVAAEYLGLRPCGGDLHCNVGPRRAASVARGSRTAGSRNPGTPAARCLAAAHRGHSLGDSAPVSLGS